jgi:hypothetical protein
MTTTTLEAVPAPLTARASLRVALREINDVAYRALRVVGSSSGEAELAARAVVAAEVEAADGIALLLDELPRVTRHRVAARLRPGPVAILDDPAGRGLLFAVPAAVEACLAVPARPVLVPGARWRPSVPPLARVCCDGTHGVELVQLDGKGRPVAGDPARFGELPAGLPAGLLVRASGTTPMTDGAWEAARRSGLRVDAAAWATAEAAARGYLVPEA